MGLAMVNEPTLKRIVPQPETSRHEHIWTVGSLYYEDVEAIHDIMSRVTKEIAPNESRLRTHQFHLQQFEVEKRLYELKKSEGDTPGSAPEPPLEPELDPRVIMRSDEFEIPSLSQLRKVPYDRIPEFRMNVWDPKLWVQGGQGRFFVSSDGDEPEVVAAFNEIIRVIKRRRSPWLSFIHASIKPYVIVAVIGVAIAAVLSWRLENLYPLWTWIVATVAYSLLLSVENFYFGKRRPAVITQYKRDAPGFWQRNGDKIIVGVVLALVASVSTVLLTVWLMGGGN